MVALGAAVGVAVGVVRLFRHPECPSGGDSPVPVLVGMRLIPKGTTGFVVVRRELARTVVVRCSELERGAISDPTYLAGRAATTDILPGQQLTDRDFALR